MDKVAFLDIASNYRRKVDDEWVDDTHWNRVTFFGKLIARVAKMSVGELVHVTGRFRQSRYERNGEVVYGTDVIAERVGAFPKRSEEHTSELQSLMRISYAVFCLKKKKKISTETKKRNHLFKTIVYTSNYTMLET